MLYNVNMSQYAQKFLTDVSAAVLHNRCWFADVAVYQATLKKVQISTLEPVTIIFFWKPATLIMV
jgi:hypothetical protein